MVSSSPAVGSATDRRGTALVEVSQPRNDALSALEQGHLRFPLLAFRTRLFLSGVLLPIGCFLFAFNDPPTFDTPWQSGRVSDYVAMLLTWPGYGPFLPMVVFSQICMAAWLIVPNWDRHLVIRLGIYGGLLVSLQFLVFVMITSGLLTFFIAAIVGPVGALLVAALVRLPKYFRRFTIRHLLIVTLAVALLIAFTRAMGMPISTVYRTFYVFIYVLMATPVLCVLAYTRATLTVAPRDNPLARAYAWIAAGLLWGASWAVSWKMAVDIMLVEYSKLSVTDPNCYVSTAAAHGHPKLVGSSNCEDGRQPINLQVKRLKFLEIALKTSLPGLHAPARRLYDRYGPPLAVQCRRSVWFADLTFLLLKPIEYASELLRVAMWIPRRSVQQIYAGNRQIDECDARSVNIKRLIPD